MDVWEANSVAAAYTPHPCTPPNQTRCTGTACTSTCDQAGCDFNSYRMGDQTFYGPGLKVDTTKKFTVVTQFLTADNTATGALKEIRRIYVQNGVVIQNSKTNLPGLTTYDSITDQFCADQKTAVADTNGFKTYGGLANMDTAFTKGVVLVLSIWDDYAVSMLWLDSYYPPTASQTAPGVKRGTCATTSGKPADVEKASPNAQVIYSNIKVGDIGSTYAAGTSTTVGTGTTSAPPTGTTSTGGTQVQYGQCGGQGWTGPTTCASPYTCKVSNAYYSQCL